LKTPVRRTGTRSAAKLVRRALRIDQNRAHPIFLFTLRASELLDVADISRVGRDDAGRLIGYQRPEVKRHVQEIADYLREKDAVFPNSIILALTSGARFTSSRGPRVGDGLATAGVLEISLRSKGPRPAWIVDGQQRALALSLSGRSDFAVPISAFVADSVDLQRDQFLRINNTRPLPRGLVTELLPSVSTSLSPRLAARKVPSALCDLLNTQSPSPFVGLIRRASTDKTTRRKAVIADTSVVNMIQESLNSTGGCLFPYRNVATNETDLDGVWLLLVTYWTAVHDVFPDAWGKPATQSRLMHGAGIRAMGRLMDKVMPAIDLRDKAAVRHVRSELQVIARACHWTDGEWEELGGLQWNELQNVPKHIRALSNVLIRRYVEAKHRS
jgi:DGQHR domain-containing protein